MIQTPRLTKNEQYKTTSRNLVSFKCSQLTAGNKGKVSTMGGNRRTMIMKNALAVKALLERRE